MLDLLHGAAPLFGWLNATVLGWLPLPARLAGWAFFVSGLSLGLYAALSPQRAVASVGRELTRVRTAMRQYDGDFQGMRALARLNISLSLRHLRLVAPSAVASALPAVALCLWLDRTNGGALPSDAALGYPWMLVFGATAVGFTVAIRRLFRIH